MIIPIVIFVYKKERSKFTYLGSKISFILTASAIFLNNRKCLVKRIVTVFSVDSGIQLIDRMKFFANQ